MNSSIRLSAANMSELADIFERGPAGSPRIIATRHVLNTGILYNDSGRVGKPKLRDAKEAVDKYMIDRNIAGAPSSAPVRVVNITPMIQIKSIIVDTCEGTLELDIDGLQLKLLDGMDTIPLDLLGSSTALIQYIRDWHEGKV